MTDTDETQELAREFRPYDVWIDFRTGPGPHWHARKPGDTLMDMLHASSRDEMRDKLQQARQAPALPADGPAAGAG